eukprot:217387-Pelagomonas_calceolata.AAC.1
MTGVNIFKYAHTIRMIRIAGRPQPTGTNLTPTPLNHCCHPHPCSHCHPHCPCSSFTHAHPSGARTLACACALACACTLAFNPALAGTLLCCLCC